MVDRRVKQKWWLNKTMYFCEGLCYVYISLLVGDCGCSIVLDFEGKDDMPLINDARLSTDDPTLAFPEI